MVTPTPREDFVTYSDLTSTAVGNGHGGGPFAERFRLLHRHLQSVVKGKPDVLWLALVCLFAEGHLLIEDNPGTGKTSIARALARSIRSDWGRIQFTPDLLPSDVTGSMIVRDGVFTPRFGPVFANVVLADEVNRASPRTQSALLEVMEERRVTLDTQAHDVPRPFMVVATQNPVEMDGTYPLPEAQLDRFLMRLDVGYPDRDAEKAVLDGYEDGAAIDRLAPVFTTDDVRRMVAEAAAVPMGDDLKYYVVDLAQATRRSPDARLGVSPRGSVALMRAARVAALADGRSAVWPEDVKRLAPAVFTHRVLVRPEKELDGVRSADIVRQALDAVPVPRVNGY